MRRIKKDEATEFSNGPSCTGVEYAFEDRDINVAVVTVAGRYPEAGYVVNEVCKEMAYVISGVGRLCREDGTVLEVGPGDATFIAPGEKYFWQGEELVMVIPCAPAFYPEQHKHSA